MEPFASVWEEVRLGLAAQPERAAKDALRELQQRYPGQFIDGQLRTLQRRVQAWRAKITIAFNDQWLREEILAGQQFPRALQAIETIQPQPITVTDAGDTPTTQTRVFPSATPSRVCQVASIKLSRRTLPAAGKDRRQAGCGRRARIYPSQTETSRP